MVGQTVPVRKASPLEAALVATEDRSFHGFGCRKRMESGVFPWLDAFLNSAGDHGSLWQGLPSS